MTEHPILFTPENAQKVHDGLKTMTRRVIVPGRTQTWMGDKFIASIVRMYDRGDGWFSMSISNDKEACGPGHVGSVRSRYQVGNRLWVREAYWKIPEPSERQLRDGADTWPKVAYAAEEKGHLRRAK